MIQDLKDESQLLERILPINEYEVYYSFEKKDGVEIARRYSPDVILVCVSDIPNDIKVIKSLSLNESTANVPLITISKSTEFEYQRFVMENGADDFIPMQYLSGSLLNSIKTRERKIQSQREIINEHLNAFEENGSVQKRKDHILIKIGNKLKLMKFDDIVCIKALKEYSQIITNEKNKVIVRKSLKNWIKVLPEKSFLQIHRATIINMDYIEKIIKVNERTYSVQLKNINEVFDFSYRYANIMRRTFPS